MQLSNDFPWPLLKHYFLLWLNNFSNKIFLPSWTSINDVTCTPFFHIAVSSFMPSSCLQPMAVAAVIRNHLSLVSLWLREAQHWWSWKLARWLFLWLRSLFVERVEKWRSPEPVGRIAKTSWPWRTRFKQIFFSSRKDSTYRKCLIALFIVASMSVCFDNHMSLPPYRLPHQCHQCSSVNRKCHNQPIRGYTGIQYTGTTLC